MESPSTSASRINLLMTFDSMFAHLEVSSGECLDESWLCRLHMINKEDWFVLRICWNIQEFKIRLFGIFSDLSRTFVRINVIKFYFSRFEFNSALERILFYRVTLVRLKSQEYWVCIFRISSSIPSFWPTWMNKLENFKWEFYTLAFSTETINM